MIGLFAPGSAVSVGGYEKRNGLIARCSVEISHEYDDYEHQEQNP